MRNSFRPTFHPQRPDGPLTKPMAKEVVGFHPACTGKHNSFRPTFHPQGPDGPLMKLMAKEVVSFHPACTGKHNSIRPTFHPQGPDGPLMKPLAKDIGGFCGRTVRNSTLTEVLVFHQTLSTPKASYSGRCPSGTPQGRT